MKSNKITIVGAGFVGAATAFSLTKSEASNEIVLIDKNFEKAKAEVSDINDAAIQQGTVKLKAGDYSDSKDSDIIIITAGANQTPGETRMDLVKKNTAILNSIIPELTKYNKDSILLIATNPVDVLTYVAQKTSGFPPERVIGTGTVLDSARLKKQISDKLDIPAKDIKTYVLGEHGDSQFPAWNISKANGISLEQLMTDKFGSKVNDIKEEIKQNTKNEAYEIIKGKGATYYGIAESIKNIVFALQNDEPKIMPVSSLLKGQYGISDVCLSLPCCISNKGVEKTLKPSLTENEIELLRNSAEAIKNGIDKVRDSLIVKTVDSVENSNTTKESSKDSLILKLNRPQNKSVKALTPAI